MKITRTLSILLLLTQGAMPARVPSRAGSSKSTLDSASIGKKGGTNFESFTTLSELVNNRPEKRNKKLTKQYQEAFAKLPKIRGIDLHQEDRGIIANEFLKLRSKQPNNPNWQKRLTATIKIHLQEAGFDETAAQAVIGHNYAYRTRIASKHRRDIVKEMYPKIPGTKSRGSICHAQNKAKIAAAVQERKQFVRDLSRVIQQYATSRRLSAIEVMNLAEETLRHKYPARNIFVYGLKSYLSNNKYSSDEITMARGHRRLQLENIGKIVSRAKRKASGPALPPSSTSSKQLRLMNGDRQSLTSIASKSVPHQSTLEATDDVNELESQAWWDDGYFDS
jgi:hypothetical protein